MNKKQKWFLAKAQGKIWVKLKIIDPSSGNKLYSKSFVLPDEYEKALQMLKAYR